MAKSPATRTKRKGTKKKKKRLDAAAPSPPTALEPNEAVVEPQPPAPPAKKPPSPVEAPLLLEIAWEACNKVGGIYTVLRSKVPAMVEHWSQRYCLIGPWAEATAGVEFEEAPPSGAIGQAVEQLNAMGIRAKYGRWLVTGRPRIVLIDFLSVFHRLHEVKYRLYADHGISMPGDDELLNNVVAFGECCRQFLWMLANKIAGRRKLVAHFHEWMAGPAIPMLRHDDWPGAITFTTHATQLGRYLAMNSSTFYDHLPFFDADAEAARYNVEPQYKIERAAAHGAHVFTTVSDVTATECKHLLGREPKPVLPNGLNIQRFERLHELQNLHSQYKNQIHEFTTGHFFPSYTFDLDNTLYFFTSGRYEYRNKGFDLFLEALARLNESERELLTLRYTTEMTYPQIAETLGQPLGTVLACQDVHTSGTTSRSFVRSVAMHQSVTRRRKGEPLTSAADVDQGSKPASTPEGVTSRFATCKIGGMLLLKLVGFIEDERAEILEVSDEHIVLRLGHPWYLRWWHGVERRRPVSVRLDFAEPSNDTPSWQKANARRSLVTVNIRPMTNTFRPRDFERRADAVLRNLRLHFVAD